MPKHKHQERKAASLGGHGYAVLFGTCGFRNRGLLASSLSFPATQLHCNFRKISAPVFSSVKWERQMERLFLTDCCGNEYRILHTSEEVSHAFLFSFCFSNSISDIITLYVIRVCVLHMSVSIKVYTSVCTLMSNHHLGLVMAKLELLISQTHPAGCPSLSLLHVRKWHRRSLG